MSIRFPSRRRPGLMALLQASLFAATAGFLLAGTAVHAQQLAPELLPALHGVPRVQTQAQPPSAIGWQLHQQLSYSPDTLQGRLDLQPSLTVALHDPEAGLRHQLNVAADQLNALEHAQHAGRVALGVHRDYLQFQQHLFLEGLYLDWLGTWDALPAAADRERWRAELTRAEVELYLQDSRNELQLLAARLDNAGVHFTAAPESFRRPILRLADEPFASCLAGSGEIRRLELLGEYQQLDDALTAAGRRMKVELIAGLNLGVSGAGTGTVSPSFGWNAGLTVARADHTGARLQFDASPFQVSQTLTIRGPEQTVASGAAGDSGLGSALEAQAQHLFSLLLALDRAAAWEDLQRRASAGELEAITQSVQDGTAGRDELMPVLQSALGLVQSALQHDSILLEVALECRWPLSYTHVPVYP